MKLKAKSTLPDPDNMTKPLTYISVDEGFVIEGNGEVFTYYRANSKFFVTTSNVEFAWGNNVTTEQPKKVTK